MALSKEIFGHISCFKSIKSLMNMIILDPDVLKGIHVKNDQITKLWTLSRQDPGTSVDIIY